MSSTLTPLERDVLDMTLSGAAPVLASLREQARNLQVASRRFSGVGFLTTFEGGSPVEALGGRTIRFGDVIADISGLQHLAGFLLCVADGVIISLEGYSFDESWPSESTAYSLSYMKGAARDFGDLSPFVDV